VVPAVLRRDEERRGVRALAALGALEPVVRDGRERRGVTEICFEERRDARSADALARVDSRERRAVMDSNSVSEPLASPTHRLREPARPALQRPTKQQS
jgi:hypothetical protein